MKIARAVPAPRAACPADSSRAAGRALDRRCRRRPGSGSRSSPTSMSAYFSLRAPTNPASALSARCASSRACSFRDSLRSACLNWGARIAGRDRFSGASIRSVWILEASASSRHAIEQDGLTDSPEADQQDALGGQAAPNTLKGNAYGVPQLVSAGKLGRRGACPWGERVFDGIHNDIYIVFTSFYPFTIT